MCEEHAQRHLGAARVTSRVEIRQVVLEWIVDCNLALFGELENSSRGRKALCHRGQIEDGVLSHRFGGRG